MTSRTTEEQEEFLQDGYESDEGINSQNSNYQPETRQGCKKPKQKKA